MSEGSKNAETPAWMAEAIAAFEISPTRYRFYPGQSYLDRVHEGHGYTPPEPVPLSFYRCLRCQTDGGVRWLGSDFDADELSMSHLVSVDFTHRFDCQRCGQSFQRIQST